MHSHDSKRNDGWCDSDKVRSWSGFLDVLDSDSHLFFYYFESRSKPADDPVVLWLNGQVQLTVSHLLSADIHTLTSGPGCSSSMGMLVSRQSGS